MDWHWILLLFTLVVAELPSKLFDLPSLLVNVDQPFLVRKQPTNLTCVLSAGYSGARMANVVWMKNGERLDDSRNEYVIDDHQLMIIGAKTQSEGDYQCLCDVNNITLSNKQLVNTRLVSSPVKLRRARITKFDPISEYMVSVRQGEVARIPCAGMPDVIPGPPEICFEKEGTSGCLSDDEIDGTNFLGTATGMQIANAQPLDSGNYFCIIRNEYVNITRRSPKPVILLVTAPVEILDESPPKLEVVYPSKPSTLDKPIVFDVVEGQDVILECVISGSKIYWMKHNDTTPYISLTNENARIRQIWGNLRFRSIKKEDGGLYCCHGISVLEEEPLLEAEDHPKVFYNLVVHRPTSVELSLTENAIDKSWELSCLAKNLDYEIPMAFVNGSALIDIIHEMGVPSSTNFFTNPINVTMKVNESFSGSVQCISRPAMDEAEIYGIGLDRGVSHNLYVMSHQMAKGDLILQGPENTTANIGDTVDLVCIIGRVKARFWKKNDNPIRVYGTTKTRIVGSNTLRISDIQKKDEGWYTCDVRGEDKLRNTASAYLTVFENTTPSPTTTTEPFDIVKKDDHLEIADMRGFVFGNNVRIQWSVIGSPEALNKISNFRIELHREGSDNTSWIEADRVASHVRATTIKDLLPNNRYRLRVILHREDGSTVYSKDTDWMLIDVPDGDIIPAIPLLDSVSLVTANTARVQWSHTALIDNAIARQFTLVYMAESMQNTITTKINGTLRETRLENIRSPDYYSFQIMAENEAGESGLSPVMHLNTTLASMSNSSFLDMMPLPSRQVLIIGLALFFLTLLMMLICFVVYCSIQAKKSKKPNGKFLDTSYRIFNEQKVHKSRIFQDDGNLYITEDMMDERSPLKKQSDNNSMTSETKFIFNTTGDMPNLYGNMDEVLEEAEPSPPNNPTYVSNSILGKTLSVNTPSARCYSPDSGTSHEIVVPYEAMINGSQFNTLQASPNVNRGNGFKCQDSLLYSPMGTACSIPDSHGHRTSDSPVHPPTDGSDQGIRCGGSSRNSQISSIDSRQPLSMNTFKSQSPHMSSFLSYDKPSIPLSD